MPGTQSSVERSRHHGKIEDLSSSARTLTYHLSHCMISSYTNNEYLMSPAGSSPSSFCRNLITLQSSVCHYIGSLRISDNLEGGCRAIDSLASIQHRSVSLSFTKPATQYVPRTGPFFPFIFKLCKRHSNSIRILRPLDQPSPHSTVLLEAEI